MAGTGRRWQETRGCMEKASTLKEVKRKMWDPFFFFTLGRLRAQSQVSSLSATFLHLKTANFLPRCRWRLGEFHVANLWQPLGQKSCSCRSLRMGLWVSSQWALEHSWGSSLCKTLSLLYFTFNMVTSHLLTQTIARFRIGQAVNS